MRRLTRSNSGRLLAAAGLMVLAFFALGYCCLVGPEGSVDSLVMGLGLAGVGMIARYDQPGETLDYTPETDKTSGDIVQLPDGRAAIVVGDITAGVLGSAKVCGVVEVAKTADIVILDGGKVFFDRSAGKAHFQKANDRDFYLGVAIGDAAATATTVFVALNVEPRYVVDLTREAYATVLTGTPAVEAFGRPKRLGGTTKFLLTATSEVQKVDALSKEGWLGGSANAIIEGRFNPVANGSGAAVKFSVGIGDGTHATDSSTVARHVLLELAGDDTKIYAKSKDGTTTVAATDTTKTITAGTPVEFWLDCRDPASVKIYIDGVRVLAATAFKLDALTTQTLFLLVHLVKTTGTTTADFEVDWLRARIAE